MCQICFPSWVFSGKKGAILLDQRSVWKACGSPPFFLRQDSALLPKWIAEKTAVKGAFLPSQMLLSGFLSTALPPLLHVDTLAKVIEDPFCSHSLEQVLMGGHARLYFPYFHCKEVLFLSDFCALSFAWEPFVKALIIHRRGYFIISYRERLSFPCFIHIIT